MADPPSFASTLRELRRERGLTARELANSARIGSAQISRYERGLQPTLSSIAKLAKALGVAPHRLADPALRHAIDD